VALGLLFGFLGLARFGTAWPPFHDELPGWLLNWISYVGSALLGPVFLAGSIAALRNRQRAGIIFLSCMPVTVFCLAYPSAGYLVWHSDGSGWFEPPEIPTAIGSTTLFFLTIFAGLLAIRYRKRAVYLFVVTAVLAGIVFGRSRVRRLAERTVQVRVTWPNGNAAAATHVGVAYEHTKDYESLAGTNTVKDTDQNGLAVIRLYGDSRVRVFAEQFVDNSKEKWWDTYYSRPVEAEVGKLPDQIHLVLNSPKP
jgi:hypothetical protein